MKPIYLLLSLFLLLSSCGYRCTNGSSATLSIPYIRGDEEGLLTTVLIAEMDKMGLYDYASSFSDFELKVALVSDLEEVIGYRYDRSHHGHIEQNLMETENRRHAAAEVTLYKSDDPVPILGPIVVTAFAEFDYIDISSLHELAFTNAHGKREKVIDFSQGQLDSIEGGEDNVRTPLYRTLAQKISRVVWKYLSSL